MPDVLDLFEEKKKPPQQEKQPRVNTPQQRNLNTPQRNNNPGNLRDPKTKAFRAFQSPQEGWHALRNDLTAKITGNTQTGLTPASTLRDLAAVYAPRSDKNDPDNWAKQVASELKIDPDTKIGKLNDKVDQFARAVAGAEGWFEGRRRRHPVPQTAPPPGAKPSAMDLFEEKQPKTAVEQRPTVGQPEAQKPAESPHEKHSWYSTSIFEPLTGASATEHYEGALKWFNQHLPESARGNYGVQFVEELSKMGPGVVDFITSPVGAGVALLNVIPQTRVIAAGVDLGLGLQSGAQAIFSVPHIIADPSPKNLAEASAAALGAYMGVRGGRKQWAKEAPKFRAAPLEERLKIQEAAKAAVPEDKAKTLQSFVPKTKAERIKSAIYKYPLARDIASIVNVPKPKLLQVASDVVRDKTSFLNEQEFRRNELAYHLRRDIPAAELAIEERMGDVIQGTAPPSVLSDAGRAGLDNIRAFERENVDMFREAYGKEIPLQDAEHYLSQMWDMKDLGEKIAEHEGLPKPLSVEETTKRVSRTLMRDPHFTQKKIPNYKYGREIGIKIDNATFKLKPLHDNVVDVIKRRHEIASKAIANRKMANTLRQMGVLLSPSEASKLNLNHWNSAPEATALYQATYGGKTPSGDAIMRYQAPKVHPDWEMSVNSSFGQPWHNPTLAAIEAYRAAGKKMALSFSIFHHGALSEQGHAIHILRSNPIKTLKQTWFANKEFWRGARSGLWQLAGKQSSDVPPVMRMKPEMIRDWLRAGLNLSSHDAESAIVKQLEKLGKDAGPVGRAITAPARWAGKLAHASDVPLWDYYHQGQMIHGAETIFAHEIKRLGPNATEMQITELRRAVSDHVNNAFGSINFEQLMLSPKARYAMNFLMLAPAWTTSNLRVVTQGLESEMGARLTGKWVAGAALSWFLTTELANYAATGWFGNRDKNGVARPHFTWDNPGVPLTVAGKRIAGLTDNSLNVAIGTNKDGTERYLKLGKGFREVFAWMLDPIQTFGSKMSLPVRGTIVMLTGSEPGTGFKVIDMQKDQGTQKLVKRIEYATGLMLPFGVRDVQRTLEHKALPEVFPDSGISSGFAGLPTAKGMTLTKAALAYQMAVEDGNDAVAHEILRAAALNRIDPRKVIQIYRAEATRRRKQVRGPRVTYDTHGNPVGQTAPPPAARDSKPSAADLFEER